MPEVEEQPLQQESETETSTATPSPPELLAPATPTITEPSSPKPDKVTSPAEVEAEVEFESEPTPKPKPKSKPEPKIKANPTDLPPKPEPKRKRAPYKPRAKKAAKQPVSEPTVPLETTKEEPEKPASHPPAPPPPPEKASTFFPVLPQDSNPIDEVILQRLQECWDEEAPRWDPGMRQDFISNIPLARVTRTTVQFTNHKLAKQLRVSGEQPSWGQWMVLRVMFGPGTCSRQKWYRGFAEAFPLAKEPAYDGVVPATAVDVLDGKALMPLQRKRKTAVWQLQRQRTRITKPKEATRVSAAAAAVAKKEGGGDQGDSGGVQVKVEQDEDEDSQEAAEKRWKRARIAVKGASKMTPGMAIRKLEQRFKVQDAQIQVLRESNAKIRRAVDGYLEMVGLLDGEPIKFEVAEEPASDHESI